MTRTLVDDAPEQVDPKTAEVILSRLWERNYDPLTTELIEGLGLAPGSRCVDLGAGAGSMSYWLAEHVSGATVRAVDVDTFQLDPTRHGGVLVEQADVETVELAPSSVDFVLARGVLSVLKDPAAMLSRVIDALAPGGWVLIEDFYFLPGEDAPTEHGRNVIAAYLRAFALAGADMRFARQVPARLAQRGLEDVDMHLRPLGPGQGVHENELMRRRLELQGHPLVDQGWVDAADMHRFVTSLDDLASRDVSTLLFSTWGRKPLPSQ